MRKLMTTIHWSSAQKLTKQTSTDVDWLKTLDLFKSVANA
jgi:hypothetical protein